MPQNWVNGNVVRRRMLIWYGGLPCLWGMIRLIVKLSCFFWCDFAVLFRFGWPFFLITSEYFLIILLFIYCIKIGGILFNSFPLYLFCIALSIWYWMYYAHWWRPALVPSSHGMHGVLLAFGAAGFLKSCFLVGYHLPVFLFIFWPLHLIKFLENIIHFGMTGSRMQPKMAYLGEARRQNMLSKSP